MGYCDASWASDIESRKSITGYCVKIGGQENVNGLISWSSRKQPTVALSSCEAEYLAVSAASQEVMFLRALMHDLGFEQLNATVLFEDNNGCIDLANNPVGHKRSKHIDVRHHYIRNLINAGKLQLKYLSTAEMVADIMTKPLERIKTEKFRAIMLP